MLLAAEAAVERFAIGLHARSTQIGQMGHHAYKKHVKTGAENPGRKHNSIQIRKANFHLPFQNTCRKQGK